MIWNNLQQNLPQKPVVWHNEEVDIIKQIKCNIPVFILDLMRSIEIKLNKPLEFGLYLKGELKDNVLNVFKDFFIPLQDVTAAHIDFNEDGPKGFNGIIHRHPNGCKSFSMEDDTYINRNQTFSLLYEKDEIRGGIINLKLEGTNRRVQLPLDINIAYPVVKFNIKLIEKIKEKTYPVPNIVQCNDKHQMLFDFIHEHKQSQIMNDRQELEDYKYFQELAKEEDLTEDMPTFLNDEE